MQGRGRGNSLVYNRFVSVLVRLMFCFAVTFSRVFTLVDRTASNVTACRSPINGSCCWPRRTPTGSWTTSPSKFLLLIFLLFAWRHAHTCCSTDSHLSPHHVFLPSSASSRVTSWSYFGDVSVGFHSLTHSLTYCCSVVQSDVLRCLRTLSQCFQMF